ncbi:MAG: hemerythrin domain-containing protein [Halioglobus sp.]
MAAKKNVGPGYTKAQWDKKGPGTPKKGAKVRPLMETLRAEHRHLASVMELFREQLHAIEQGELVDTHVIYEIMDYLVRWPDRFHHPREDLIYARVAEIDASAADNVDSLQREHDVMAKESRAVLRDIERWREGEGDGNAVIKSGGAYVERLFAHMNNEEKLVFPQIEAVLTATDWRELEIDDQLRPVTDPVFGGRVDREFRNMARKLRRKLRVQVERGAMIEWVGIEALMESIEVLSMAYDNSKNATGDHLRGALDDAKVMIRENLLTGPLRCVVNNTKITFDLVGDVVDITKDAIEDLSRVNQARKDRVRLVAGD